MGALGPPLKCVPMKQAKGKYHGFDVHVGRPSRIRGAVVRSEDVVLVIHDQRLADRDGGWTRTEPAVFEKIVLRDEVQIDS